MPQPAWRDLSAADHAALPESRLGGALALIFIAACGIVAVPVAGLVTLVVAAGPDGVFWTLGAFLTAEGLGPTGSVMRLTLVPQAALFLWAVVFIVVTAARLPAGPRIAALVFAFWATLSAGSQVAIQLAISPEGIAPSRIPLMLPFMLLDLVLAAAFWGYMHDGRRPNIYYRRRVPAG
jgi:hypothetical protein